MNGLYSHEVSKFEISQCVGMSKRNGGGATHSSLNCLLMSRKIAQRLDHWQFFESTEARPRRSLGRFKKMVEALCNFPYK